MSILDSLITYRTAYDVQRLTDLMNKGWQNMTADEKNEFLYGTTPLMDANGQLLYDSNNEPLYVAGGNVLGAYNYTDLNRVEEAVDYIADELVQAPLTLQAYATSLGVAWDSYFDVPYDPTDYSNLTIKTNWAVTDIPSVTQMNRYYNNLALIRAALPVQIVLPSSMNYLTYSGANDIERMLLMMHDAIADEIELKETYIKSAAECYKSGEFYSGEVY